MTAANLLAGDPHQPFVSVIVPAFRDWERLEQCLAALAAQSFPAEAFEIIVANNDPADPSRPARLRAQVRLVDVAAPGSYAARNAAVAVAKGEVLAFTDSDCVPDPDWLRAGVAGVAAHGDSAWITGPIRIFRPTGGGRLAYVHDLKYAFNTAQGPERQTGATANLIVRRDVFDRVGPFDASLFSGGDTEWKERAASKGVAVRAVMNAVISHPSRGSVADLLLKERRRTGGRIKRGERVATFATSAILPPIGLMRSVRWADVPKGDTARMFLLLWYMRWVRLHEAIRVKVAGRTPERR